MVGTYLELVNVYLRLDLPNTALDVLAEASYEVMIYLDFVIILAGIYSATNLGSYWVWLASMIC